MAPTLEHRIDSKNEKQDRSNSKNLQQHGGISSAQCCAEEARDAVTPITHRAVEGCVNQISLAHVHQSLELVHQGHPSIERLAAGGERGIEEHFASSDARAGPYVVGDLIHRTREYHPLFS